MAFALIGFLESGFRAMQQNPEILTIDAKPLTHNIFVLFLQEHLTQQLLVAIRQLAEHILDARLLLAGGETDFRVVGSDR